MFKFFYLFFMNHEDNSNTQNSCKKRSKSYLILFWLKAKEEKKVLWFGAQMTTTSQSFKIDLTLKSLVLWLI